MKGYLCHLPYDLKAELLQHLWISKIDQYVTQLDEFASFNNDDIFWGVVYQTHLKSEEKIDNDDGELGEILRPPKKICLKNKRATCLAILDDFSDNGKTWPIHGNILAYMIQNDYFKAIPYILDSTNDLNKPYTIIGFYGNKLEEKVEVEPIILGRVVYRRNFECVKYLIDNNALSLAYKNETFLDIVLGHLCLGKAGLDMLKYFIDTNPQIGINELLDHLIKYIDKMEYNGTAAGVVDGLRYILSLGADKSRFSANRIDAWNL